VPLALERGHQHFALLPQDPARERPLDQRLDLVLARAAQHALERETHDAGCQLEESLRRGVGRGERALLVHDHDPRAHGLEHGFRQPAAVLELLVLAHETGRENSLSSSLRARRSDIRLKARPGHGTRRCPR